MPAIPALGRGREQDEEFKVDTHLSINTLTKHLDPEYTKINQPSQVKMLTSTMYFKDDA